MKTLLTIAVLTAIVAGVVKLVFYSDPKEYVQDEDTHDEFGRP